MELKSTFNCAIFLKFTCQRSLNCIVKIQFFFFIILSDEIWKKGEKNYCDKCRKNTTHFLVQEMRLKDFCTQADIASKYCQWSNSGTKSSLLT